MNDATSPESPGENSVGASATAADYWATWLLAVAGLGIGSVGMLLFACIYTFRTAGIPATGGTICVIGIQYGLPAFCLGAVLHGLTAYIGMHQATLAKRLAVVYLVALVALAFSIHRSVNHPDFYIRVLNTMPYGHSNGPAIESAIHHLAAFGDRAVEPAFVALRNGNQDVKAAFGGMGEPAHRRLLVAIKSETDTKRKMDYVDAMQRGFGDFQYLPQFLDYLVTQAREHYVDDLPLQYAIKPRVDSEMPFVFVGNEKQTVNPEFKRWYRKHTVPHGPFPVWH